MQQQYAFQPLGATGTTPTAQTTQGITNAVQQLTLPAVPACGGTLRIAVNSTSNIAWSFGVSASLSIDNGCFQFAATITDYTLPGGITQISYIGSATNGDIRVMVGVGI